MHFKCHLEYISPLLRQHLTPNSPSFFPEIHPLKSILKPNFPPDSQKWPARRSNLLSPHTRISKSIEHCITVLSAQNTMILPLWSALKLLLPLGWYDNTSWHQRLTTWLFGQTPTLYDQVCLMSTLLNWRRDVPTNVTLFLFTRLWYVLLWRSLLPLMLPWMFFLLIMLLHWCCLECSSSS